MKSDRFSNNETEELTISKEFLAGEFSRALGYPIKHNPYGITERKKMDDWAKGWCDRDMCLATEIIKLREAHDEKLDEAIKLLEIAILTRK